MGVEQHRRLHRTVAWAVLLPADLSSCRSEGGPRESQRAKVGGNPGGGILEVVARQPHLQSRAGKGAQEGDKPGVGRI
jgi:hypothetical protein